MTGAPDEHVPELAARLASGGAAAVIAFIAGHADAAKRRQLFSVAQREFGRRENAARDLDALIAICRAGIDDGIRQAEAETSPVEAAKRKDFANVLSYNFAADLAECWDGDKVPRARRHFEAGLAAAKDCIRWRDELGKPAWPRS